MKRGLKIFKKMTVVMMVAAVILSSLMNVNVGKAASLNGASANGVAINATNFPDEKFRRYMLFIKNKNNNDILDDSEIKGLKDINLNGYYVENLKGIEYLYDLEELYVGDYSNCGFTTVDLSKNLKLKRVLIYNNANLEKIE